jgi:hypothetical protein
VSDQFRILTNIPGKRTREDGPYSSLRSANTAVSGIKTTLAKAWKNEEARVCTLWIERNDNGHWVAVGGVDEFQVGG